MGILDQLFSTSVHDLVGMLSRMEALEKLLDIGSVDDVRVVGIVGESGVGKSTLSAAVYDKVSNQFDASCFLADVTKTCQLSGLITLQEQLLREILKQENLNITMDDIEGTFSLCTRLRHLRTLIVLDDISDLGTLKKLAGFSDWFRAGSRIIVTTTYWDILSKYGVNEVYWVEPLNKSDSLQLFCLNAFKYIHPEKNYKDLIHSAVEYVQGHPLAIKLLGSFLLNQSVMQWRSALARLERFPHWSRIHNVIQESYNALEDSERKMILYIACFFAGKKINYLSKSLCHLGIYSEYGIRILIDKSFITISYQMIRMHGLVQEQVWEILSLTVHEEQIIRKWHDEHLCQIMNEKTGTDLVKTEVLNLRRKAISPGILSTINLVSVSNSLSSGRSWKYVVFISFRGEDTCNGFTDDLFAAFKLFGIKTFMDGPKEKGKVISPVILEAIEHSRISIVVFSRNYTASTCCLEELAKIAECLNSVEQTVWPIFYDVNPFMVKEQRGLYQQAFAKHEERFKENLDKVEKWRENMKKVANLTAWDVQNEIMTQITYTIVQRVIAKWSHKCISNVDELVGIHAHVEELEKLLNIGLDDVKFIGICGIGGIGKTTIASVVYHRIFHLFEAYCFLDNISEYTHASDLICLQKQLLCATKEPKVLKVESVYEGTWLISTRLRHRRTLLVLDDVDHFTKIQMLARSPDWFGAGSRIIITTRDEHVLRSCGVNEIHKVGQLKEDEALQLFCRNAFKCDHPLRGYEEFTSGALEYAKGHPLAIKSLGSFLLNRSVCEWKSAEAKSQAICQLSMGEVLRKSFVQLRNLEREIFLDIACFFVGEKINYVKEILNHCRSHSYFGIKSLIGKSLITISNERIQMHDMLKELGWEFVWKESPKSPGGRSRLWLYEDFCLVMNNSIEAKSVKGIVLNQEDPTEVPLMAEAFSKMINLRLLIIRNVKFSGRLIYLSNQLRYLSWHKYPFTYLPLNFEPHKLVEVVLHKSRITLLWKGVKTLTNLTRMDLRGSGNLVKMPDFKGVPNLERLDLGGCSGLLQLHPSIAALPKLSFLNLKSCTSLISIPNSLFGLSSLEILNLAGCLELAECLDFDDLTRSMKVKELSNQDLPLLEEIGKPSNSDYGYDHENVEPCVNLYEECRNDVAKKTIECFPHGEKLAIQVSNYKSKNKACSFQMGDAFQEMTEYPKAEAVDLVKAKTYRAMSIESISSKITPVQYTIAKCIDALDDIDGVPNDKYVKALEKFKDPDWREIFLSMSHSRKKAWLDSLV